MVSREDRLREHFAVKEREQIDKVRKAWESRIPHEYQQFSVDSIRDGRWNGRIGAIAARKLRAYLEEPTKFLLLHGQKGLGKSSMAATIGGHFVSKRICSGEYRSMPTMLQEFSFRPDGYDPLTLYSRARVLVLDDVGAANEGITPHQQRCLWSLIDNRWSSGGLITIMTTNMSIRSTTEGQGLIDWFGESSWDRIQHDLTAISFKGDSMRMEQDDNDE